MKLENDLFQEVKSLIGNHFGVPIDDNMIQFQKTRPDFEGDLTLVVFPLVKIARKSPEQTAQEIGQVLCDGIPIVSGYNAVQGFLNLVIDDQYWINELNEISEADSFGTFSDKSSQVMVEYSSPNTNKPLHLGHLRNNFLGHSVSRILEANGHEVIKTQIVNDRGIHICKSMLAWQRFGKGETPESSGIKGDKLVGKYYVIFDQHLKEETKIVLEKWAKGEFSGAESFEEEYRKLSKAASEKNDEKAKKAIEDKIKKLANNATPIMLAVKDMLVKWEAKEAEVWQLWEMMNSWVYQGFDSTYKALEVEFDHLYYESETYLTGKSLVEEGLKKGLFFQKEDGSVWADLSAEGLDEKLLLRGDGTSVYMTQDIGTAQLRMNNYPNLDGIVYTVGNEQDHHFKVLFIILEKLGYKWAKNCYHLSYGMVDLRNDQGEVGRMKSREGTVVDADDLLADVVSKAKEMTEERGHIEGMSTQEKDELFKMIGLGGLKYYLLKVDPSKRMTFNPEESVELNGNTGPFIQYVHARISSLLRKANELGSETLTIEVSILPIEKELIKKLVDYPETIRNAGENYSPALIANYAFELSKLFNSFWQSVTILKEEDDLIRTMRTNLSREVAKVLKSAMFLLGINVPERM